MLRLEWTQKLTRPRATAIEATAEAGIANMHIATKYGNRMMREFIADDRSPENQ